LVVALLSSSLLLTDGDEQGGAIPFPFCGHCIRQFAVRQDRQQTASLRRRKHIAKTNIDKMAEQGNQIRVDATLRL
jgi:hypothetical protein